ncbi:chromosome partitioning protein [Micromonospora sp. NPDC000207]|uniref:chromosome partitioning protein n=1 Tax=Micromonospora sp. NPDC000207 TaxID=3154246 RepID=UPI0033204656
MPHPPTPAAPIPAAPIPQPPIPQPPTPAAPIPQPPIPAAPTPQPPAPAAPVSEPTPADPIPQPPIPAGPDPAAPEAEGTRPGPRPPTFAPPVPAPPRVDQSGPVPPPAPVPPAAPHPAPGHADPATAPTTPTAPPAAPEPGAHTPGPVVPQAAPGPEAQQVSPEAGGPYPAAEAAVPVSGPQVPSVAAGQGPAGWYPATWQQGSGHPMPPQSYPGAGGGPSAYPGADAGPSAYPGADGGPSAYPATAWSPEPPVPPTAEDFARRRQLRPPDPVATVGLRAVINKTGLVKLPPGRHEQELRQDIEMVRRNFGGLRQVTVVNPKGGAGKTVAILLLAMTFGQKRGGYVLAWDNNETQGTLGMRAQQDFHSRTVRDLLRDLGQFEGAQGRVGDLSQYVRSQGEGMFDVLASDESATGGEMLTAAAFGELREVVSRFYKLIFVDTGNNVRAHNWQAAMDATDQLVVTMSARNDSAETAARMLDHLEQSGRQRLVRQAVTVVSMPPSRKEIDLPAIQQHFAARTRAVLLAPYERLIDSGEPIRYGGLSAATRDAWLKIAASVAEGL